jgi:hypothetical protein
VDASLYAFFDVMLWVKVGSEEEGFVWLRKASQASDPSHCDFQIKSFINWPACKIQEQRNGGVFAGWVST